MKSFIYLVLFISSALLYSQDIPRGNINDLEGNTVEFEKLIKSDSPVIVSFWATWCMPCIQEMDEINKYYNQWKKETGVKFIAISLDNKRSTKRIPKLIKRKGWNYDFFVDNKYELAKAYKINSIPLMLIFKNGKLIYKHQGYYKGVAGKIYDIIKTH